MPINVSLVFQSLYILFNISSFILASVLYNKTISFVFFKFHCTSIISSKTDLILIFAHRKSTKKGKTGKDNSRQDVYIQVRLSLAIGHVFIINSKIMLTNKTAFKPTKTILRQLPINRKSKEDKLSRPLQKALIATIY